MTEVADGARRPSSVPYVLLNDSEEGAEQGGKPMASLSGTGENYMDMEKGLREADDDEDDPLPDIVPMSCEYAWRRFGAAMTSSLTNRYLFVNILYLIYTLGILVIDTYHQHNRYTAGSYRSYIALNCLQLLAAILYLWAWKQFSWIHIVMIPEYLNITQAILFIASSTLYSSQDSRNYARDDVTHHVISIETTASVIAIAATIGWICSWWLTYLRTPGRGWTLDDPDILGWACTMTGACLYLVYYIELKGDQGEYSRNYLYIKADIIVFVGAAIYFIAAMRDDGWFWFMPLAGQWKLKHVKVLQGDGLKQLEDKKKVNRRRRILLKMGAPPVPERYTPQYWVERGMCRLWARCTEERQGVVQIV